MYDVFISYKSEDLGDAKTIMEHLEDNGISCFFAPRDIKGGRDYSEELVRAVKSSNVLLFLLSKWANEDSKNVKAEIENAWNNNVPIVSIRLDNVEPNEKLTYFLESKQFIDCYEKNIDEYLSKITGNIKELLPAKEAPDLEEKAVPVTTFIFDPETGRMINPRDGEPNVSFRVDTFINLMGGIYENVLNITGNEEAAQEIFFKSGYISGKNFADRIISKWGNGSSVSEIKKKIAKWCEFDSVVGWGKFEADIIFDEENESFEGTLTITEAFIVDKKNRRKVCAFIRGYCTGVLQTLLNDSDVELTCRSCPLIKKFNNKCVFDVKMK